ncbi:uncharacterized protein PAC_18672 [Phialocephala subalpina]|uniref:Uncharacterized protein n=1 Tax=Phialocephala subalpina TaxID=576137 RepID=A0A1L7XUT1_9HELO|nr:uncharacterized protein PAC_18672 [Phialocephala subalpina]
MDIHDTPNMTNEATRERSGATITDDFENGQGIFCFVEEDFFGNTAPSPSGADVTGYPKSFSSLPSPSNATLEYLPLSCPVSDPIFWRCPFFGLGTDELLFSIDDYPLMPPDLNFWARPDMTVLAPVDIDVRQRLSGDIPDLAYQWAFSATINPLPELSWTDTPISDHGFNFTTPTFSPHDNTNVGKTPFSIPSQESSPTPLSSQPSPRSRSSSISTDSTSPPSTPIICIWDQCGEAFKSHAAYNTKDTTPSLSNARTALADKRQRNS